MDAVNKVVNAASTALWGEDSNRPEQSYEPHGEEPISGVQGKGAATDPYDAGNREEQPEAPATEDDTAPQKPQLPGQSLNSRTTATAEKTTEAAPSGSNADGSSSIPAASSSASNETNENKPSSGAEQRNTETTEGESSTAQLSTVHDSTRQQASKEALRGPQGPPPHPAEEFEKETKGDKPVFKDVRYGKTNDSTDSSPKSQNKSSQKSGSSDSGSGKHSTMAKMKKRLNKVAHPRHANPKGTAE